MVFRVKKYAIPNKVVIWGNDNSNMLGVLRQLSENNIFTYIVFNHQKARMASASKYCKHFFVASSVEEGISFIKDRLFTNEEYKPILISTGDLFAEQINAHYDVLSIKYHIAGFKEQGVIEKYLDKNFQNYFALKTGLNIPHGYLLNSKDCMEFELKKILFPCIIKPARHYSSYDHSSHKFKIKVCESEQQVKDVLNIMEDDKKYMIQEYIQKDNLVVINGCRLQNGSIFISGALVCENGGEESDSSFGYITEQIPSCINKGSIEKFVEEIDYYGPFGFDFAIKDNKAYFLEMNLRIDATNYLFYKMGGQFLITWIFDVASKGIVTISQCVHGKKYFMDDIGELHQVLSKKMPKSQWRSHFCKAKIHKFFNWRDMLPFILQYVICYTYPYYNKFKKIINHINGSE